MAVDQRPGEEKLHRKQDIGSGIGMRIRASIRRLDGSAGAADLHSLRDSWCTGFAVDGHPLLVRIAELTWRRL